jgi:apolipoprotein N-acyltransferase
MQKASISTATKLKIIFLKKHKQAARAGAKMVLWQECAGTIPNHEEKEFIKRATAMAAQEKIYLLMTLWSVPEDFPKHLVENKMIIIDQRGEIQSTYVKNNPVPGAEPIVKGTLPYQYYKPLMAKLLLQYVMMETSPILFAMQE